MRLESQRLIHLFIDSCAFQAFHIVKIPLIFWGIFSFGDEDLFHQESTESEYNFSDDEDDRKAKDDTIMSERYVNNPLQKQDSVTSITREKSMQPRWKKILTQLRKEREKNNKIKSDGYTDKLKLSTKELERTHSGSLTRRMSKRFSFLNLFHRFY